MMTNYIIGAGASASILKKFFPNAKVISPKGSKTPEIFYLWDNPLVRTFLSTYSMSFSSTRVTIGFIPKKPKNKEIGLYNKITFKPEGSMPSQGRKSFKSLVCEIEPVKIDYKHSVKNIIFSEKKIITDDGRSWKYDNIFWTAPHSDTFYSPITFISVESVKQLFVESYLYLFKKELLEEGIYRITRKRDNSYVIEIAGRKTDAKIFKMIKLVADTFGTSLKYDKHFTRRFGHIGMTVDLPDLKKYNVYFFGRYAQLNHEIMISDVIIKAMKLLETGICS